MESLAFQLEPARAIMYQIGAFMPRLLIAALVMLGGWLLAKLAHVAVTRALRAVNFHVLAERAGLDSFLKQGGMSHDTTAIVGLLVYWLVILAALLVASNGLGLSYISDLLGRIVWFVPNVFVAILVLAFGSYFARFVGNAVSAYCHNIRLQDAAFLGKLAQYAILVFVVLIALDQIQVGGDIVRESFLVILAGIVFAFALAFGLGGKEWAAQRIARWWPSEPAATDDDAADRSKL
jgi:hypothetical protein